MTISPQTRRPANVVLAVKSIQFRALETLLHSEDSRGVVPFGTGDTSHPEFNHPEFRVSLEHPKIPLDISVHNLTTGPGSVTLRP